MATLRKRVSAALRERGFRREGGGHLLAIDADFSFWVHVGPIGWQTDIAPGAGIRSERVEALMAELMALAPDPWHPTGAANVGYLVGGEYRAWYAESDLDDVLATTLAALERLHPLATLATLADLFALRGVAELPHRWHALATIALLNGEHARVRECLAEGEREMCAQDDEICADFRAFQARVVRHLSGA